MIFATRPVLCGANRGGILARLPWKGEPERERPFGPEVLWKTCNPRATDWLAQALLEHTSWQGAHDFSGVVLNIFKLSALTSCSCSERIVAILLNPRATCADVSRRARGAGSQGTPRGGPSPPLACSIPLSHKTQEKIVE
jgi:hypothetical protein